jgi:hypothetical protein
MLEVQPRDIQIMKFVFACRVVTYDQIIQRHFKNTHVIVASRRIRRLANAGFFKLRMMEVNGRGCRIVQATPSLWPFINEKWPFEIDVPHFKSESPEHDVRLTSLILRLEQLRGYRSFYTENLLQSSTVLAEDPQFRDLARLQSDGALAVVDTAGRSRLFAIEFELSKKTPDRYRQKFINYYLGRGFDGVLYVSPERQIERLISRIDDEVRQGRPSIVHFADEQLALSQMAKITFLNSEGGFLELE